MFLHINRVLYKLVIFGSGAHSGKMLLVRIVENNEIDAYFWEIALQRRVRKGIVIGPKRARKRKNHSLNYFQ